jgi:transcriptional regulator with XRE-family HTH domain
LLGEYLRGERQKAGLSIEELSKRTLIRRTYLEALENEDYQVINGDVYVRGYIRAYLNALGVPSEEAIELYEQDIEKNQPEPLKELPPPKKTPKMLYLIPVGLLSVALVLTFILMGNHKDITPKTTSTPTLSNGIDVVMPLEEAEAKFDNRQLLEINTLDETWIYLVIDNKLKYSMLLEPGDNKRWSAESGFFLKIGNAGGIEITYNGIKYGIPGKKGQVIRLHLPEDLQKLSSVKDRPK